MASRHARAVEQMQVIEDQDDRLVHRRQSRPQARDDRSLDRSARRRQRVEHARVERRDAVERGRDIRQQDDRIVVVLVDRTHANGRCDREAHCASSVVFPQPGPADRNTTGTAADASSSKPMSALRGTVPRDRCGARSFDSSSSNAGMRMADRRARACDGSAAASSSGGP